MKFKIGFKSLLLLTVTLAFYQDLNAASNTPPEPQIQNAKKGDLESNSDNESVGSVDSGDTLIEGPTWSDRVNSLPDSVKQQLKSIRPDGTFDVNQFGDEDRKIVQQHYENAAGNLKPGLLGMTHTRFLHRKSDGTPDGVVYSEERKQLHDKIVQHFLGGDQDAMPAKGQNLKLIFTAGAPGSGKSTVLNELEKQGVLDKKKYVVIDPDAIRVMLPEYSKWTGNKAIASDPAVLEKAATFSHREALDVSKQLYQKAIEKGKNVLRDGTLKDTPYLAELIQNVHNNKSSNPYQVGIVHVDVDPDIAQARVIERGKQTKRIVNLRVQKAASPSAINQSADQLKRMSDFYIKINNDKRDPKLTHVEMNPYASKNANLYRDLKSEHPSQLVKSKVFKYPERANHLPNPIKVSNLKTRQKSMLRKLLK